MKGQALHTTLTASCNEAVIVDMQEALEQPCPPFTLLSISNLIPAERLAEFEAAGGDLM